MLLSALGISIDSRIVLTPSSLGWKLMGLLVVGVAGFDEINQIRFKFETANADCCGHYFGQFLKYVVMSPSIDPISKGRPGNDDQLHPRPW